MGMKTKRILAILLASVMSLSMYITAFAGESGNDSGTATVTWELNVVDSAGNPLNVTHDFRMNYVFEQSGEEDVRQWIFSLADADNGTQTASTELGAGESMTIRDQDFRAEDWITPETDYKLVSIEPSDVTLYGGESEVIKITFRGDNASNTGGEDSKTDVDTGTEDSETNTDFVIEDGVLVEYRGTDTAVTIPEDVTAIGEGAFAENTTIEMVYFPENVLTVGYGAFRECTNLKTVSLGSKTRLEGGYQFYGCTSLSQINVENLTSIGVGTFYGCTSLDYLYFPKLRGGAEDSFGNCTGLKAISFGSAEYLSDWLFEDCENLETVYLPDTLTFISPYAFEGCDGLNDIYYAGSVEEWDEILEQFRQWGIEYTCFDGVTIHFDSGTEEEPGASDFVIENGVLVENNGTDANGEMPDGVVQAASTTPKTGDTTPVAVYVLVMGAALAASLIVIRMRRSRN